MEDSVGKHGNKDNGQQEGPDTGYQPQHAVYEAKHAGARNAYDWALEHQQENDKSKKKDGERW